MSDWQDKRNARNVLGWKTEKGSDISISHIGAFLEGIQGNVLEIGPGSGNLLQYLPKTIHYTCIEPNRYLHKAIRAEATRNGFSSIDIIQTKAEHMPLKSGSFDMVVSVRSLCSMNAGAVLQEVKRVLKTGGKFVFVEHVAAPQGSFLWLKQKLLRYPRIIQGGCDPAKNIESIIKKAGFTKVNIERFTIEERELSRARIAGVAIK